MIEGAKASGRRASPPSNSSSRPASGGRRSPARPVSEVTQRLLTVAAVAGPSFAVGLIEEVEPTLDREALSDAFDEGWPQGCSRGDRLGPRLSVRPRVGPSGSRRRPRARSVGRGDIVASPKRSRRGRATTTSTSASSRRTTWPRRRWRGGQGGPVRGAGRVARPSAWPTRRRFGTTSKRSEVLQWEGEGVSARSCDLLMAYAMRMARRRHASCPRGVSACHQRRPQTGRRRTARSRRASQQLRHRWLQPVDRRRSRSGDPAGGGARSTPTTQTRPAAQLMARLAVECTSRRTMSVASQSPTTRSRWPRRSTSADPPVHPQLPAVVAAGSHMPIAERITLAENILALAAELDDREVADQARCLLALRYLEAGQLATRITRRMRASGSPRAQVPGFLPWVVGYRTLEAWLGPRRRRQATERAGARPGTKYPQRPRARVRHLRRPVPAIRLLAARAGRRAPAVGGDVSQYPEVASLPAAFSLVYGLVGRQDECRRARRSDPGRRHGRHPQ